MAANDGGVPPILAPKHYAQPSAFTPENLLCEARAVEMEATALYAFARARRKPVLCFAHVTNQMGRVDGDFEKGEADGSRDAMRLIAIAADRLRSRVLS
jgi:purine-nucleoside phosphorylase